MSKIINSTFTVLAPLIFVSNVYAFNEQVTLNQTTPGGSITATLAGMLSPCSFFFVGPPSVNVLGSQISISSPDVALGCPPPPGGGTPSPYTQSATVGVLPDGYYTVTWRAQPFSFFRAQAQYVVQAGALIALDQLTLLP